MKKIIKLLCILFLVPTFFFSIKTTLIYGDLTQSNCVVTKVGNPTAPSPTCQSGSGSGSSGTSNSTIVNIGEDIKAAYDACSNGYTYDLQNPYNPSQTWITCLDTTFQKQTRSQLQGYTNLQVQNFETRRKSSMIINTEPFPCTECLGYVGIDLAVLTGNTDALGSNYGSPNDILTKNPTTLTIGNYTFTNIGAGNSVSIQPGDLAVTSGHIAIVKSNLTAQADTVHFIGLQSNYWGPPDGDKCKVTDDIQVPKDLYTFYRTSTN